LFDPGLFRNIPPTDWIALSCDETRVVAHGPSFSGVVDDAMMSGEINPLITRVPMPLELVAVLQDG
jgi:hypothetical protein